MSVTMDKQDLEFEREASSLTTGGEGEGLVFYSAAVGNLDDGARIAVSVCSCPHLRSLLVVVF